jgi:DNA-binding MarR family transcriptional regulator
MPKQLFKADTFTVADSVGYLVKHAQRAMHDRIESAFASQSVTFQQWIVLMHLRDGMAGTVAELCRSTRHDSGAMTRLVDQLEQRGLIERQRKPGDRRVVDLALTPAGRKMVESLIPIAVDTLNHTLDGFSRQEVQQLQGFMRRIIARLGEIEAGEGLGPELKKVKS